MNAPPVALKYAPIPGARTAARERLAVVGIQDPDRFATDHRIETEKVLDASIVELLEYPAPRKAGLIGAQHNGEVSSQKVVEAGCGELDLMVLPSRLQDIASGAARCREKKTACRLEVPHQSLEEQFPVSNMFDHIEAGNDIEGLRTEGCIPIGRISDGEAQSPVRVDERSGRPIAAFKSCLDKLSINASSIDITMWLDYIRSMRTTINLPESALELAKRKAAEEDASLGEVIAEAIYSTYLARPAAHGEAAAGIGVDLPVSQLGGGLLPGVRLESNAELEDVMNGLR